MFGDLDNDGLEDVFFTNGIEGNVNDSDLAIRMDAMKKKGATFAEIQREMAATPRHTERNLAFRNQGDLVFEDASSTWGLDLDSVSHGAVLADLDRDGDLDLIVNNMNDPVALYRNDIEAKPNSLVVQLRGDESNRFGLGARVVAKTSQGTHTRIMTSSRGYQSGVEPVLHFGLGDADTVDQLEVHWPSGILQRLTNIKAGNLLTIHEAKKAPVDKHRSTFATKPLLAHVDDRAGLTFAHTENVYNDYAEQPLLPNRLSRFGPAMAAGDANGDGRDDLYFGGAAGQAGALYLQQASGTFTAESIKAFASDASHEDTAAIFLDFDGDDDLDLYVVSGGASAKANDAHYEDRLYVNGGSGKWPRGSIPSIRSSGGCVAAADFDKDGDQDLFVGSRFLPKKYPYASPSTLLVNGSQLETQLMDLGLVTGATWADVDGDTWLDLLVTREWGAPVVLLNKQGVLKEAGESAGLAGYYGWWNALAAADIDADGDVDFVATNFGTNTKYTATAKKSVRLYAGDFAGDGSLRIIEAKTKDDQILPVRGKSCSTHAMPHLANKFPTYKSFASATLTELYGATSIDDSLQLSATTLASMVFLNNGKGQFEGHALPWLAQLAPGFGIVLADLDDDTHLDCVIAQNFYHPQRETGRMNASLGAFLKGDGEGQFKAIWPNESGLRLRDDMRSVVRVQAKDRTLLVFAVNDGLPRVYAK